MPLVGAAVLAYAAGLLSGYGDAAAWTIAAGIGVVWLCARQKRERLALGAIAVAGLSVAVVGRGEREACRERLAKASSLEMTLGADASPGAFVSGRHECGIAVRAAVDTGSASGGARVVVRGQVAAAQGGVIVLHAHVRTIGEPGTLPRFRANIARRLDSLFGERAPLVRALLIADMQDLSPTLRARFAAAGLSHMLSVSGLHVGLIAIAVALIAQVLGMPRGRGDVVVVIVTTVYVVAIGAPLPAVRAAAMLGAYSLGRAVQRPTSPWAVLAIGAVLPLADPRAVTDVGYQLSVVGMVALVAAGSVTRRWSWTSERGWRGVLYRSLVTSTVATGLTAPLVAATFGRISLVAPVSNLVAVPVMAVLQPMLFLVALLLPFETAARFVADACVPLLAAIDWIASLAARLPGASINVVADQTAIAFACAAGVALVVAAVSRFPGRGLVAGLACIALLVWRPLIQARAPLTELHMIDVGQGDAVALRTTRGHWVLVDAGREWRGGNAGQRDIVPYIAERGGDLVAFVLSHPHSDHVGGAASILEALRPRWYFDPGYAGGTTPYRASLLEARQTRTAWRRVRPGDSLVVDEVTITILAPDSAWAESQSDPNLASTVARIRVGQVTMLLTGDAEAPEERWLLANQRPLLGADILKVGHHGSRTSTTPEFLEAVSPRLALISVGAGNMYGHPNAGVLRSLAAHGAITLRTDRNGSLVVLTDGRRIEVEAAGDRWTIKDLP